MFSWNNAVCCALLQHCNVCKGVGTHVVLSAEASVFLHHPVALSPVGGVITPSARSCMVSSSRCRAFSGLSLFSHSARTKPRSALPVTNMSMSCEPPRKHRYFMADL